MAHPVAIQSPHTAPWTFWRVVWATLVLVAIGLSFWLLYRFHQVLFILFIAIIMGTVLRPPVSWLQRRGIPGVAGVILVYLLLLALLIGFALLLVPVIVEQTTTIAVAVPDSYQSRHGWIVGHPNPLITQFSRFLPATLSLLDPGQSTGQELLDTAGLLSKGEGSTNAVVAHSIPESHLKGGSRRIRVAKPFSRVRTLAPTTASPSRPVSRNCPTWYTS